MKRGNWMQSATEPDAIISDNPDDSCHTEYRTVRNYGGYLIAESVPEQSIPLIVAAPKLLAACKAALSPDPCQLDHHGYCQAHKLGNPCEQKLLREAIAAAEPEKS